VRRAGRLTAVAATTLVAGCGNFFPNPDNVTLPSGVRDYELRCGTLGLAPCEERAAKLVVELRVGRPAGVRLVRLELDEGGGYTATFSDSQTERMIVD
jgi:hypothetical protein